MMNKLISFLSGGQSDFLIPLSHQWHGVNVAPPLYMVAFLGAFAAIMFYGMAIWSAIRRRPSALFVLLTIFCATAAYAASSTLSGLTAGGAISDTDLFYDVQSVGSGGVKVTGAQLKTYMLGSSTNGQILNNSGGTSIGGVTAAIATGCGATGGTIGNSLSGTIASAETANAQTGAGYTTQATDCGKLITLSNASAETLTLNNLSANQFFDVLNIGAGTWTITAGTGAINGGCTSLAQNQGGRIQFDGTNWNINCGAGSGGSTTITAGTTATSGFTDKDIINSSSSKTADTGLNVPSSGVLIANGTTGPTLSAGQLALGGTFGTPVAPGAANEGQIFLSSTGGLNLMGRGSSTDINLFSRGGTSSCTVSGSNAGINCPGGFVANTSSALVAGPGQNSTSVIINTGNTNSGTSAASEWILSNNTNNFTFLYNSTGNSGGNGTGSFTMNNPDTTNTGGVAFQTGGTNALTIDKTQLVALPAITTDATHTDATVCEDTTTHKLFFGSGTAGVCLGTSSARFKDAIAPLTAGLEQIQALQPIKYRYKPGTGHDTSRDLYGLIAEDVAPVLPKLVSEDSQGRPDAIDYLGLIPVLINAIKEQQAEIEALKRKVR